MALKGGDKLAACHVPQPQGLVRRATGDGLAVWTVGHASDLKQAEHESEETFCLSFFISAFGPGGKGLSISFIEASFGPS